MEISGRVNYKRVLLLCNGQNKAVEWEASSNRSVEMYRHAKLFATEVKQWEKAAIEGKHRINPYSWMAS